MSKTTFEDLPKEIIALIALDSSNHLPPLFRLMRVCKKFYNAIEYDHNCKNYILKMLLYRLERKKFLSDIKKIKYTENIMTNLTLKPCSRATNQVTCIEYELDTITNTGKKYVAYEYVRAAIEDCYHTYNNDFLKVTNGTLRKGTLYIDYCLPLQRNYRRSVEIVATFWL